MKRFSTHSFHPSLITFRNSIRIPIFGLSEEDERTHSTVSYRIELREQSWKITWIICSSSSIFHGSNHSITNSDERDQLQQSVWHELRCRGQNILLNSDRKHLNHCFAHCFCWRSETSGSHSTCSFQSVPCESNNKNKHSIKYGEARNEFQQQQQQPKLPKQKERKKVSMWCGVCLLIFNVRFNWRRPIWK